MSTTNALMNHAREFLSTQNYGAYTPEEHAVWAELVHRRTPQIQEYACAEYLEGYEIIDIREDRIPNLAEISSRLRPRTAWSTTPVTGFLPARAFFEMLSLRHFPSTTWLRKRDSLEYTPEPDIFHDVFGHVPMHAHKVFADFLQYYGQLCLAAEDEHVLEKLGRLFWYSVEFGLIRQNGKLKIFGSGVISSHGESTSVIEGKIKVEPFDLDRVLATPVTVDEIHDVLFAIDSFDQMYEALMETERRLTIRK